MGVRAPEAGVKYACELSCCFLERYPDPLQEQQVLLIGKLSLPAIPPPHCVANFILPLKDEVQELV